MKAYRTRAFHLLIAVPLAAACSNGDELEVADTQPAQEQAAELESLTPEQIAALAEEYPRLTADEPLPPPQANGDRGAAPEGVLETVTGEATFYAEKFEGRRTASGIPFRQNQMVAAHRGYPFGTLLRVTNLSNNRSANVRVVDRGPFGSSAKAQRTVIDLSRRAAEQLGYIQSGRAQVRVEVLEWGRGIRNIT